MNPGNNPAGSLVETPSGLIVPADSIPADAKAPEDPAITWPDTVATDPDGRRRIVMTRDDRRTINRALQTLGRAGLGVVVGCHGPCGQPMLNETVTDAEGKRELDSGYGCKCSRIHFR